MSIDEIIRKVEINNPNEYVFLLKDTLYTRKFVVEIIEMVINDIINDGTYKLKKEVCNHDWKYRGERLDGRFVCTKCKEIE